MKPASPIFIGVTRSFLIGILPAGLVALDVIVALASDPETAPPIAGLIAAMTGYEVAQVEGFMRATAPFLALIVAQQRAGSARPYTLDPRAIK